MPNYFCASPKRSPGWFIPQLALGVGSPGPDAPVLLDGVTVAFAGRDRNHLTGPAHLCLGQAPVRGGSLAQLYVEIASRCRTANQNSEIVFSRADTYPCQPIADHKPRN
jgi:hypothetical protein